MTSRYLPAKTVLFEQGRFGLTYRIPALCYLAQSAAILAFAEERLSPADADATVLVFRRGAVYKSHVQWGDMEVLHSAYLKNHRSMNPCPVYDNSTDTLFLFFIAVLGRTTESYQLITGDNVTRLCCVRSTDHGQSWSAITDLTECTIGCAIEEWATFALGPGHGIQLPSGRLVVPAYAYHIDSKECFGKICRTSPHSFMFYSDDHGTVWRSGDFIDNLETVECQVVSVDEEDGHGVVYCNARTQLNFRAQALSTNGGAAFQDGHLIPKLVEPPRGCHGSIVGFPAPVGKRYDELLAFSAFDSDNQQQTRLQHKGLKLNLRSSTWVLYAHPTSPTSRRHLGVYLSTFPRDPCSWTEPWVIHEGPSAYSDLAFLEMAASKGPEAQLPAVAFACLYECGASSPYEKIAFSVFTMRELFHNIPHPPAQSQVELSTRPTSACCPIT
ncbi:sialidase-4 [Chiloscyllium plagiosum]|uniref:sialidase-4 n=1 Tax=Chiloscyllium plagiosum TaxID=36176 RepID=UPI001CB7E25A|nr:sialidase-4 [Chiloscyllium plagiosum]